jgi:hypothetical protein
MENTSTECGSDSPTIVRTFRNNPTSRSVYIVFQIFEFWIQKVDKNQIPGKASPSHVIQNTFVCKRWEVSRFDDTVCPWCQTMDQPSFTADVFAIRASHPRAAEIKARLQFCLRSLMLQSRRSC